MSESGPGADPRGSTWDNPSWSSSLSDSSLSRSEEQPPNPWSRQASPPEAGLASGPASAASANPEPDPHSAPDRPAGSHAAPGPGGFEPQQPGSDPQPTPPYGGGVPGATSYGSPTPAYAAPPPPYAPPPAAYGSNPYETNPYQPAYGGVSPYGAPPPSHPQASTAMIFGILGIVFAFSCGVGGLLGIPGIVLGRRVRNEIDAQPGRYGGRSQAQAGYVTGIIGVVVAVLITALLVVVFAAAAAAGEF